MSSKSAIRAVSGIGSLSVLLLAAMVCLSPERALYDEPSFIEYARLFGEHGPSHTFMNALPGAAGPLYGVLQGALAPLTGLDPVKMRLVNLALLLGVAAALAHRLRHQGSTAWAASALSVMAVPMSWVMGGMALSEMPALLLVTVSLCLQLRALGSADRPRTAMSLFAGAAVPLGIAVWGRQPYLLLAGVPVLLAIGVPHLRSAVAVFCAIVLAVALPQFAIWQGVVPPSHQAIVHTGLSPVAALLSLGYVGFCFFLLAPTVRWVSLPSAVVLLLVAVVANATFDLAAPQPLRSFVDRYAPSKLAALYGALCGTLLMAWGLIFLTWLLRQTWQRRRDLSSALVNLGLLCVTLSPLVIGHQYSSRYSAMALPYLILAADPWRCWGAATVATTAIGVALGATSLSGYFAS